MKTFQTFCKLFDQNGTIFDRVMDHFVCPMFYVLESANC